METEVSFPHRASILESKRANNKSKHKIMPGNTKKDKKKKLKQLDKKWYVTYQGTISIFTDFSSAEGKFRGNGTTPLKC